MTILFMMLWPIWLLALYGLGWLAVKTTKRYPAFMAAVWVLIIIMGINHLLLGVTL